LRAETSRGITSGSSPEEFDHLLHAWFGNLARVLLPGRAFYVWGGYANVANYPPVFKATGLYFSQAIIWDKQHPVLTRKDYMGAHEWCFYGWRTCWQQGRSALDFLSQLLRGTLEALALPP
jgi:DNA modification methylase